MIRFEDENLETQLGRYRLVRKKVTEDAKIGYGLFADKEFKVRES
jgi:hypothetical protein